VGVHTVGGSAARWFVPSAASNDKLDKDLFRKAKSKRISHVKKVKPSRHLAVLVDGSLYEVICSSERKRAMPAAEQTARPSQEAFEAALEDRIQARQAHSASELRAKDIREGISFERLEQVADRLDLTQETLTRILGTSERTLQRRRREGRLNPAESDRFGRLERLCEMALRAFDENEEEARRWLTTPKRAFDGETPVEHLDTEPGARAAQEMLVVIDQTIPA
jgi:putative toxin-antitoxin system antitoxin component (TIGR02293 family)